MRLSYYYGNSCSVSASLKMKQHAILYVHLGHQNAVVPYLRMRGPRGKVKLIPPDISIKYIFAWEKTGM